MLALLLSLSAAASNEGCASVDLPEVLAGEAPQVIVLGEHPGHTVDLRRALRAIKAARRQGPVTVALEAVDGSLDVQLARLEEEAPLDLSGVPGALSWEEHWLAPFTPYQDLFAAAFQDEWLRLVAVGADEVPPDDARVDVPAGEPERLAELAGGLPFGMRQRIARARSWSDDRIATAALNAWDGKGTLFVLVDRTRVAGRGGVAWHLRQRTEVEVRPVVLSWSDSACTAGTLIWEPPVVRGAVPGFLVPEAAPVETPGG